jgi:hypothetical protein
MHSRAAAAAIAFKRTTRDSMKTTLLLTDELETTRLMLKDVAFDDLSVRHIEAHAGCKCDRWGHPCADCFDRKNQTKSTLQFHQHSNSELNRWNM